jgi:hypothetical protein
MALHSLETRILLLLVSMRLMRLSNIYAKIAAETSFQIRSSMAELRGTKTGICRTRR